jgi:hypothetical protein
MKHIAWLGLLWASTAANASPVSASMDTVKITTRENENIPITTGEPARDRTIFTVLSLVFMMVLAFLFGACTLFWLIGSFSVANVQRQEHAFVSSKGACACDAISCRSSSYS